MGHNLSLFSLRKYMIYPVPKWLRSTIVPEKFPGIFSDVSTFVPMRTTPGEKSIEITVIVFTRNIMNPRFKSLPIRKNGPEGWSNGTNAKGELFKMSSIHHIITG